MSIDIENAYIYNRKLGEQFLENNKSKKGVITLENGLQYRINTVGLGARPNLGSKVKVHYTGMLVNGIVFDKSREKPLEAKVRNLIKGWVEALQLMPVGSAWTLFIPQHLGYGSSGSGVISPYSTLIFDIELLSFK